MSRRPAAWTNEKVRTMPRPHRQYTPVPGCDGLYIRARGKTPLTYVGRTVDPLRRKTKQVTYDPVSVADIDETAERWRSDYKRIKAKLPLVEPAAPQPDSFAAVANNWLSRYVDKSKLRTGPELHRQIDKYLTPHFGDRPFVEIRRSEVAAFLDHAEDKHGDRMADVLLTTLRSIMNWHAARDDDYVVPLVKGMRRVRAVDRRRDRVLTDDELRAIWKTAHTFKRGQFGALVLLLLLTAQRLHTVQTMRFSDIDANDVWTIPVEKRAKQHAGSLRLPKVAIDIVNAQPTKNLAGNPFVFTGRSGTSGHAKMLFDKACGVTGWRLHDARRTARSLMSRAGIRPDIAERVLGHAIVGVGGTYDRHKYDSDKAEALAALATLIQRILAGPVDNVVPMVAAS